MISSRWLLSVSLKTNGDLYPRFTLIDQRKQKSTPFHSYKHCLQQSVSEKLALVRIKRGDYDRTSVIGTWIGDRHLVVALDKDEYEFLLGLTHGSDTREQGKKSRKEDTG